jgi:hypothetical protein
VSKNTCRLIPHKTDILNPQKSINPQKMPRKHAIKSIKPKQMSIKRGSNK